jgi:hypothetical protein
MKRINHRLFIVSIASCTVLFGIAAFLRLWILGHAPFPADEIEFFKIVLRNQGIIDLWCNPPWLNQIPLNEIFPLLLIRAGLPATPFVTRLPFAVMGVLSLVIIWHFTRRFFSAGAALVVLILAVSNPYQLYYSRTAYHYAGATCWAAAMLLCFWSIKEALDKKCCPHIRHILLWLAATTLGCHMHMSVWVVAAMQGVLMFGLGFFALRQSRPERNRFMILAACSAVALVAVMSRWIYRAIRMILDSTEQLGSKASDEFIRLSPAYFAGENLPAVMLLVGVASVAGVALWRSRKTQDPFWSFSWIACLHISALMLYVGLAGGGLAKITYFSSIWPFFICFLGIGLWKGLAILTGDRKLLHYGCLGLILAAYVGLTLPPAWAIVRLDGKPMPIFKINEWARENLPSGAPVLVDRWFHPWNELAIHNTHQINYTFTVPDEPVENYIALDWRKTAEGFFAKHPDAAFLEMNPNKYIDQVGPWRFPAEYFARMVSITNEQAMTLRRYRVFPKSDYAEETLNLVVTRIFYNTTDDIIQKARSEGLSLLLLHGNGWRYLKPWQPMQGWPEQLMQLLWIQAGLHGDERKTVTAQTDLQNIPQQQAMHYVNQGRWADYRIPTSRSVLRLFNLTEQDLSATLTVTGIALSGNVRCMIGKDVVLFPQTLMTERHIPITLKPGESELIVAMPMNQFMLVHDVRLAEEKK